MDNVALVPWFRMRIRRTKGGTVFTVKADPRVEAFFKGNNRVDPVELYGRTWRSMDTPLMVYAYPNEILDNRLRDQISLEYVAGELVIEGRTNLSFLRFEGISEGVSFLVTSPISVQRITSIKAEILAGVRAFLYEYVVPLDITLELVSREAYG